MVLVPLRRAVRLLLIRPSVEADQTVFLGAVPFVVAPGVVGQVVLSIVVVRW